MSNHQLTATTALDYQRLGKLSAVELLQDCLKQIAARETVVGAWKYINPDDALQQAEQRDAMQSLSKVALVHSTAFQSASKIPLPQPICQQDGALRFILDKCSDTMRQ